MYPLKWGCLTLHGLNACFCLGDNKTEILPVLQSLLGQSAFSGHLPAVITVWYVPDYVVLHSQEPGTTNRGVKNCQDLLFLHLSAANSHRVVHS